MEDPNNARKRSSADGDAGIEHGRSFPFYFASWYKKSPYFEKTVEAGCTSWDLYNHMLIPTYYDDDIKEYWHLVEKVTLRAFGVHAYTSACPPGKMVRISLSRSRARA